MGHCHRWVPVLKHAVLFLSHSTRARRSVRKGVSKPHEKSRSITVRRRISICLLGLCRHIDSPTLLGCKRALSIPLHPEAAFYFLDELEDFDVDDSSVGYFG